MKRCALNAAHVKQHARVVCRICKSHVPHSPLLLLRLKCSVQVRREGRSLAWPHGGWSMMALYSPLPKKMGGRRFERFARRTGWRSVWGQSTTRHRLTIPVSIGFANCLARVLGCYSPARHVRSQLSRCTSRRGIAAVCCLSIWYARECHHSIRLLLIAKKLHANTVRSL